MLKGDLELIYMGRPNKVLSIILKYYFFISEAVPSGGSMAVL